MKIKLHLASDVNNFYELVGFENDDLGCGKR